MKNIDGSRNFWEKTVGPFGDEYVFKNYSFYPFKQRDDQSQLVDQCLPSVQFAFKCDKNALEFVEAMSQLFPIVPVAGQYLCQQGGDHGLLIYQKSIIKIQKNKK